MASGDGRVHWSSTARAAVVAVCLATLLPASAGAATQRTSFQMVQLAPSRVSQETSFLPFALPDPIDRIYTYRLGSRRFVGPWIPASAGGLTATSLLDRVYRGATTGIGASGTEGVIVDRPLTARERGRFRTLADLYRDADVLVVAAGHPACTGLTVAQARAVARGTITRWSQVAPGGAAADAIRVRHLVGGFGGAVPHLGTRWVGTLNRQRVNYAPGAVGAGDGGVSAAAAGDQSIAAITTWSRIRYAPPGVCVVPLNGVAPNDATVTGLTYPEAFPVRYVVTRKLVGGGQTVVMRRAMATHLNSARVKAMLRRQGLLVVGDPPLPPPAGV